MVTVQPCPPAGVITNPGRPVGELVALAVEDRPRGDRPGPAPESLHVAPGGGRPGAPADLGGPSCCPRPSTYTDARRTGTVPASRSTSPQASPRSSDTRHPWRNSATASPSRSSGTAASRARVASGQGHAGRVPDQCAHLHRLVHHLGEHLTVLPHGPRRQHPADLVCHSVTTRWSAASGRAARSALILRTRSSAFAHGDGRTGCRCTLCSHQSASAPDRRLRAPGARTGVSRRRGGPAWPR